MGVQRHCPNRVKGPLYQGRSRSYDHYIKVSQSQKKKSNINVNQRLISVTGVKEKNMFVDTLLSLMH